MGIQCARWWNYRCKFRKNFKKKINENIEVYSLGVPSYSGIIYQGIAKTYFDILKPDLIIIAIDQSDFYDDEIREKLFEKDENNSPSYYSNYKVQSKLTSLDGSNRELKSKIKLTSSLVDKFVMLKHKLFDPIFHRNKMNKLKSNYSILKYEDIPKDKKMNLSEHFYIDRNTICCDLKTSKEKFKTTFNALKFVKNKSDEIGAKLYFSTYPYSWFIDPNQSLEWQLKQYGGEYILAIRNNNVYPELVNDYAEKLSVKNLNFYEFIKNNPDDYWGEFDPHFNALGYKKYAEFLSREIINFLEN